MSGPYLALYPIPGQKFSQIDDFGDGTVRIAGPRNQPTNDDFAAAKMDHRISDANLLFGTYNFSDSDRSPFGILGDLTAIGIDSRRQIVSTGLTTVISPTVLNGFIFGYSFSRVGADVPLSKRDFSGLQFLPGRERMGQIRPDVSYYTQRAFMIKDGLSLTRGNHSFRLGVQIDRPNLRHQTRLSITYCGRKMVLTMGATFAPAERGGSLAATFVRQRKNLLASRFRETIILSPQGLTCRQGVMGIYGDTAKAEVKAAAA